jgi:hypothetical protein
MNPSFIKVISAGMSFCEARVTFLVVKTGKKHTLDGDKAERLLNKYNWPEVRV